jgi:hypothetical protein
MPDPIGDIRFDQTIGALPGFMVVPPGVPQ